MHLTYFVAQANWAVFGNVLRLCRHAVSVFCCPSWLHILGYVFPVWWDAVSIICNCSQLSPCWGCLTRVQTWSQSSLPPQPTEPCLEKSYPLCKGAVSVYCSPSRLERRWGCFNRMQRCSQRILQPASADWAFVHDVLPVCRYAVSEFCSLSRLDHLWECVTPLQRWNQRILQPQTNGPPEDILPLCSDAVIVFCRPRRMDPWGYLTRLQWCSQPILQSQPTEPLFGMSYPLLQRCNQRILQPQLTRLSLVMCYPYAEMQSLYSAVYSAVPADCRLIHLRGCVTPMQRCSQCILQSELIRPSKGMCYSYAEMQSVYSAVPAD